MKINLLKDTVYMVIHLRRLDIEVICQVCKIWRIKTRKMKNVKTKDFWAKILMESQFQIEVHLEETVTVQILNITIRLM